LSLVKKDLERCSLESKSKLKVKSFVCFSEYCRSSLRSFVETKINDIHFYKTAILIFEFKLWFDLAIRFEWFSVGGFLKFNSFDYVTEIYNFMQYNLLNANVHCAFSYFDNKNNCLYFWLLFNRKSDFVKFKEEKKFTFLLTKWFSVQNYRLIDNFLKSYMSFYPVNENLPNYRRICDYRTASYYVGIYSNDFYILSLLYENIIDFQSMFFSTDTLQYTMSSLLFDITSGEDCPIALLRQETGLDIQSDIWLFCKPYVNFHDFIFILDTHHET
jgi:hypothetical protein